MPLSDIALLLHSFVLLLILFFVAEQRIRIVELKDELSDLGAELYDHQLKDIHD